MKPKWLLGVYAAAIIGGLTMAARAEENMSEMPEYTVQKTVTLPPLDAPWDDVAWVKAKTLDVAHFHAKSSTHQPKTQARVLHDGKSLCVMFRVEDRYVVARAKKYQDAVYKDSCVEFFVRPKADGGYFNFEMNCGGTLLLNYHEDPTDQWGTEHKRTDVSEAWANKIEVHASLPKQVLPEREEAITWTVSYRIPIALFEDYDGELGALSGQTWRANFYKCADDSSHPHWGTWAPIGEGLRFHQPKYFGLLRIDSAEEGN